MVDLEILETNLTKKDENWYEVNIIFNQDFEMTFYVMPKLDIKQYYPNETVKFGSYSTDTTTLEAHPDL